LSTNTISTNTENTATKPMLNFLFFILLLLPFLIG
jgi:hypothetical protein